MRSRRTSRSTRRIATKDSQHHAVVLGGAGFVGSHLVDALLAGGSRVTVLDDLSTGTLSNIEHLFENPSATFLECDVTAGGLPVREPVDVVYHLASPASPVDYRRMPLETLLCGSHATLHALRLAAEHDSRFVFASTSEVYGDPEIHPQAEEYWGHVNPVGPRSQYDEAKRFGEALTVAHGHVDWVIARLFNTYGPRMRVDDGRVVPTFIRQALHDEPLTVAGDGRQTRSFCHVHDTVRGLVSLAASDYRGPVNLGNPQEITIERLAQRVIEATGSTSVLRRVPLPADDPRRRCPDIARAREVLGWAPQIGWLSGLGTTVEWYAARIGASATESGNTQRDPALVLQGDAHP